MELTTFSNNLQQASAPPLDHTYAVSDTGPQHQASAARSGSSWKPIVLQKYSLAICFLEFLAIALLLSYLFLPKPPAPLDVRPNGCNQYQHYTNGANSTKLLVGQAVGCNQRQHDLHYSVVCHSSHTGLCQMWGQDLHISEDQPDLEKSDMLSRREGGQVNVIRSSKSGDRFKQYSYAPARIFCNRNTDCDLKTRLLVSPGQRRQEIIGWGGALTDSSINNILSLTTNGSIRLLDDYFGPNGLKFNMVRLTIGGSDFSSRFYTNDDLDQEKEEPAEDFKMSKFELTEDDLLYKIPMIENLNKHYFSKDAELRSMRSHGELKLFGSMWSPPTWMKTNEHFNKGQIKGSFGGDERYFAALAQLKRRFLLAYAEHSINFWGLTVMNEPIFAVQPFLNFNTMIFPRDDYAKYVAKYLGPTLRNESSLKHIKLIAHDDNRRFLFNFTEPILRMPGVASYIDGVATHGYIDEDYHLMKDLYDQESGRYFILPTELSSGHLPFMEKALVGNWNRGIHYAMDILRSLQNSAAGWVDWNMVLDTSGGPGWLGGRLDSPIIVDKQKDMYHKSPMYYALGQFSRYIPPGSRLVESELINTAYDYQLEQVTFELPGETDMVTVVLNNNPYPIHIYVQNDGAEETGSLELECMPESLTTFMYKKSII